MDQINQLSQALINQGIQLKKDDELKLQLAIKERQNEHNEYENENETKKINNYNNINTSTSTHSKPGDRIFLETEKLQLLIRVLEAICDVIPADESQPRMVAFLPEGLHIMISVPREVRCHVLNLPRSFFGPKQYKSANNGYRMLISLPELLSNLNKIYGTHRGRCVQIIDQPDNTLLIHGLLDDHKFIDGIIVPRDIITSASNHINAGIVLDKAYYRYPFLIQVSTEWLHSMFKRLQGQSEVYIEFEGSSKTLTVESTSESGAPCREGDVIPDSHILKNPFLDKSSSQKIVHININIINPNSQNTNTNENTNNNNNENEHKNNGSIDQFYFKARFHPRSLWLALKRPKLSGGYVHLFMCPGEPLLIQFLLQSDYLDSRQVATYSTWIKAVERVPNPNLLIFKKKGITDKEGACQVVERMTQIQPSIGTLEETFQAARVAIHEVSGHPQTNTNIEQKVAMNQLNSNHKRKRPVGRPPRNSV